MAELAGGIRGRRDLAGCDHDPRSLTDADRGTRDDGPRTGTPASTHRAGTLLDQPRFFSQSLPALLIIKAVHPAIRGRTMDDTNAFADFVRRIRAGDGEAAAELVRQH